MINAFGGLGGFVGTYVVGLLGGAGSSAPFVFLAACLFLAAGLMFVVRHPRRGADATATDPSSTGLPSSGPAPGRLGRA